MLGNRAIPQLVMIVVAVSEVVCTEIMHFIYYLMEYLNQNFLSNLFNLYLLSKLNFITNTFSPYVFLQLNLSP